MYTMPKFFKFSMPFNKKLRIMSISNTVLIHLKIELKISIY